ncbi:MAG TPA: NAD-dependent epimerase/dehydratase family protein, partial [Burkholderiales bacterium]|nr:NAD-dependent epimerase/dehydratase family protein [Burkholderiales bacterium]
MKLLVTGGTGMIGDGVIPALLAAGHDVRILSRGAQEDARQWPEHVEAFPADVADAASLEGCVTGCDAIVHIVGIAKETASETFATINVEGTRNIVAEAERAGVERFVFMSSLGADRGESEYHRSKRSAEEIVRGFKGSWVILRPGKVYGPGDEAISMLLRMVRTLPIVPMVAGGDQSFQPIWYRDLGVAVAKVLENEKLTNVALDIAGSEVTTTQDILDRLSKLTGDSPHRVRVPKLVVSLGVRVAHALGVDLPIDQQKLTMLLEENVIHDGSTNGL